MRVENGPADDGLRETLCLDNPRRESAQQHKTNANTHHAQNYKSRILESPELLGLAEFAESHVRQRKSHAKRCDLAGLASNLHEALMLSDDRERDR